MELECKKKIVLFYCLTLRGFDKVGGYCFIVDLGFINKNYQFFGVNDE
jgi:hypothetical protein